MKKISQIIFLITSITTTTNAYTTGFDNITSAQEFVAHTNETTLPVYVEEIVKNASIIEGIDSALQYLRLSFLQSTNANSIRTIALLSALANFAEITASINTLINDSKNGLLLTAHPFDFINAVRMYRNADKIARANKLTSKKIALGKLPSLLMLLTTERSLKFTSFYFKYTEKKIKNFSLRLEDEDLNASGNYTVDVPYALNSLYKKLMPVLNQFAISTETNLASETFGLALGIQEYKLVSKLIKRAQEDKNKYDEDFN